jgi:hypothetical protein
MSKLRVIVMVNSNYEVIEMHIYLFIKKLVKKVNLQTNNNNYHKPKNKNRK